jgi:hypothetical protein
VNRFYHAHNRLSTKCGINNWKQSLED